MGWNWKVLKAAVEQEILFPNKTVFENYVKTLDERGFPYEVLTETSNSDGSYTVIMRKRYNPVNEFFSEEEKNLKMKGC